jgi:DNA primase
VKGEIYLGTRKLPYERYYICTAGAYRDRIVIPYYDENGKLIYFNGRYMGTYNKVARYQAPDRSAAGVGKDDVLYFPEWPISGSKLYLTEGEFDADSIYFSAIQEGHKMYTAAFGGKNISDKHLEIVSPFMPVLCVDTDKAGKQGVISMNERMRARGLRPYLIRPPKQFKDWNKMLQEVGPKVLITYIRKNEKPITDRVLMNLF